MNYTTAIVLLALGLLISCQRPDESMAIPWSTEDAGKQTGFSLELPKMPEQPDVARKCIQDFKTREHAVIVLKRTLHMENSQMTFLVFEIEHTLDGPAIVYAVESGDPKFKFRCTCGLGS